MIHEITRIRTKWTSYFVLLRVIVDHFTSAGVHQLVRGLAHNFGRHSSLTEGPPIEVSRSGRAV